MKELRQRVEERLKQQCCLAIIRVNVGSIVGCLTVLASFAKA